MNLYLESLEGGFFIAAMGEENNRRVITDSHGKPLTFNSMAEVRSHFYAQNFEKVWLRQCTPYDEMVGQPGVKERSLDIELAW